MEYGRTECHQFCDTDLCMIIDAVTGEPTRLDREDTIITFDKALRYLEEVSLGLYLGPAINRVVVVKLSCVQAFELKEEA